MKSLNFVFMEMLFEFQTLVKLAKAVLDLLNLDLTSAKVPPASSRKMIALNKKFKRTSYWILIWLRLFHGKVKTHFFVIIPVFQ